MNFYDKDKEDELEDYEDTQTVSEVIKPREINTASGLDAEIAAKNQVLADIIANGQKEEQSIRDNYNSFGSRLARAMEVFGAGLKGENTSEVLKNQQNRFDTQLKGAQERFKNNRDTAYKQMSDLLARKDALDKAEYDRSRDQAKDKQWEQEFGLKTKTQADQNAIQQAQLDILRNQATEKKNQEIQNAQNENANKVLELQQFNDDVNDFLNTYSNSGAVDRFFGNGSTEKNQITDAKRERLNYKILKRLFPGLSDKELIDKYDEMKDILLNPSQSKKEAIDRLKALNVIE